MNSLILLSIFILASFSEAQELCVPDPAVPAVQASVQFRQIQCAQNYQEHNCEEYKNSLEPSDQSKVLSCSASKASATLGEFVGSCADGLTSFVVDTATDVVKLITDIPAMPAAAVRELSRRGQFLKSCNENRSVREALFETVSPLYNDAEKNDLLNDLSCDALIQTVQRISQTTLVDIQRKKQLQERFKTQNPGVRLPPGIRLTTGEEEFEMNYFAQADRHRDSGFQNYLNSVWARVNSEFHCFTPQAKVEMACYLLTRATSEVALGAGKSIVGFTTARVKNSLERIGREIGPGREGRLLGSAATSVRSRVLATQRRFRDNEKVKIYGPPSDPTSRGHWDPDLTLEPGTSYTAMVLDGKLILGLKTPGPGKAGSKAGTHLVLEAYHRNVRQGYLGRGGAIRLNQDGSIDISGYHNKTKSEEAARALENMIKEIHPQAITRTTPDRLSALDGE